MKLSSVPQIYRHLGRWGEIISVLSKYGLADWISRLGPDFAKDFLKARTGVAIARHRWETRVRMALAELGPTFIKLGQVLSMRPDLVGVALADELQHLQEEVPGDPFYVVQSIICEDLGKPVEQIFAEFDPEPIASASIGQVHRARLRTGEKVAVKVRHADIERKLQVDLDILVGFAQWAEKIPELTNYRPRAIAAEFQRTISRELDFSRELRNLKQFARQFADDPTVHIPRVYRQFSTDRVLTMEFVEGIRLIETERMLAAGIDLREVAWRFATMYLKMIFAHGFYHADPHPGNIVLMDGNVIGLLDHGMVGQIDERLHDDIVEMILSVVNQDAEQLAALIIRVGAVPQDLDRATLSLDMTDYLAHYTSQSLGDFDLSGALKELMEIIRHYRISLPARLAVLLKVLMTLEGTSQLMNPDFSLMEVIRPYRAKLMLHRFSPVRQLRRVRRFSWELKQLIEAAPRGLLEILEQVQTGKFDVHLDHRGLEPSVNRLVLGMLASTLFLSSALMLIFKLEPLVCGVSLSGAIGCLIGFGLGWRLWRVISRSMDRRR